MRCRYRITWYNILMVTLTIQGELCDLNAYIKALNSSRWGGNNIKQSETERVAREARIARICPITEYPVHIIYRWYSKDKRKDIDNTSFSKKFLNDGLVQAGILENDGRKHVAGFTDEFYIDKEYPHVEITILSTGELHDNTKTV